MEEVQRSEKRATLEDIMYASVLEKFLELGVDMLGSMDLVQVPLRSVKSPVACLTSPACQHGPGLGATAMRQIQFVVCLSSPRLPAERLPAHVDCV